MNKAKGFTLVEVAVAIAVVAILSGIIIPLVVKNIADARRARARNDLQVIAGAVASQLKDTGSRRPNDRVVPWNANGLAPSGLGLSMWASRGRFPRVPPGIAPADGADLVANRATFGDGPQSFRVLFTSPTAPNSLDPAQANRLFGFPPPAGGEEFRYKGPYMTLAQANTADPWGNSYLILGYNKMSMDEHRPIWVICAGESGAIERVNLTAGNLRGGPPAEWDYRGVSRANMVIQIQ